MSNLLFEIGIYRPRAHTIFKSKLFIYEDYVVFRSRKWFRVTELTIPYNHIAQVNIISGIVFADLELVNSGGGENAHIQYVLKKKAKKAKRIIDQKVHGAHLKGERKQEFHRRQPKRVDKYEKSLSRLKELLAKDKITEREFEKKRRGLLKHLD